MASDLLTLRLQFGVHTPRSVTPRMPPKGLLHFDQQRIFRHGRLLAPVIISAATHFERPTQGLDRMLLRLFFNELVPRFQVGREKMLKAFFKMSRSISTCLSFWRNCSSSRSAAGVGVACFHL